MRTQLIQTRWAEQILFGIGLTLLYLWGGFWIYGYVSSRSAIEIFELHKAHVPATNWVPTGDPVGNPAVDFGLWSPERAKAYNDSMGQITGQPLAILRVPNIHLEVPVYNDTDDLTLNRGVGRILGTAQVGGSGNLGIAGHRDGFFRGLKNVAPDEEIDLDWPGGSDTYKVKKIEIVSPEDISVLAPTTEPTLTLVTCFPFYFLGSAPRRYIVTASLSNSSRANMRATEDFNSTGTKTKKKENQK
jgi:sortase A